MYIYLLTLIVFVCCTRETLCWVKWFPLRLQWKANQHSPWAWDSKLIAFGVSAGPRLLLPRPLRLAEYCPGGTLYGWWDIKIQELISPQSKLVHHSFNLSCFRSVLVPEFIFIGMPAWFLSWCGAQYCKALRLFARCIEKTCSVVFDFESLEHVWLLPGKAGSDAALCWWNRLAKMERYYIPHVDQSLLKLTVVLWWVGQLPRLSLHLVPCV